MKVKGDFPMKMRWIAALTALVMMFSALAATAEGYGTEIENLLNETKQGNAGQPEAAPAPQAETAPEPEPEPAAEPAAEPEQQPEKPVVPATKIVIHAPPKEGVKVGTVFDLAPLVSIQPIDASKEGLTYKSSDDNIAPVGPDGKVRARSTGKVTITVSDPLSKKSAKVTLTIIQPVEQIVPSKTGVTIPKGKKEKLTADVLPSYASNKKLEWTSKDERIAKVSNGVITGVNPGTTFVHCTATDGSYTDTAIMVTVVQPVKKIVFATKSMTVMKGKDAYVSLNVEPSDATNRDVEFSSSNPSVADVSSTGRVTGKNPGVAIITATAKDGSGVKTNHTVYVEPTDPVDVDYLWWETRNYVMTGRIKLDIINLCVNRKIKMIHFTARCYNSAGKLMGESFPAVSVRGSVAPGKRKTSDYTALSLNGLNGSTSKIEILISGVSFDDGTLYTYHYGEEPVHTFQIR